MTTPAQEGALSQDIADILGALRAENIEEKVFELFAEPDFFGTLNHPARQLIRAITATIRYRIPPRRGTLPTSPSRRNWIRRWTASATPLIRQRARKPMLMS